MAFDDTQPAYQALRSIVAERTQPLLAWTGAGLSAPADMPTWLGLRERLAAVLESNAASMTGSDAKRLAATSIQARSQKNPWVAFQMLANGLGGTTFRDEIRAAFAAAERSPIPEAYRAIWKLRVRGLLNLNLDGLATRAYSEEHPGAALVERSGPEISRLRHVLSGQTPFIGNLHGLAPDSSTWVFTQDQLAGLLRNEAYTLFLRMCLGGHTVIFLGMTVDDFAVGGHLESLARLGREDPTHFWVTDREDPATNFWAEQAGVRVVRYSSRNGDHSAVIELLADLHDAAPREQSAAPPVYFAHAEAHAEPLAGPEEIRTWPPNDIRVALNAHAKQILSAEDEAAYAAYEEFRDQYDEAIHSAWYTSAKPGRNELLGYTLIREVATGAFGRVYEAISPNGDTVAVKVLLENIRNETEMLHSFRRGVRSMRILSDSGVAGMVRYHDASEVPAFVVMDWVNGTHLGDAKRAGWIEDWPGLLAVATGLVAVLRRAHGLPERVLHRDLRPENVMLRDFYGDFDQNWEVVVLDFDLSWHKGAQEKSLLHQPSAGYLAPEQFRRIAGVSTRSAAVDSFGLGMTLLFLCRGDHPLPDEHRNRNFADTVIDDTSRLDAPIWRSVPRRFARLILRATEDRQSSRWDLAQIEAELTRLASVIRDTSDATDTELITEELAARTAAMEGYEWDQDALRASTRSPTGLRFHLAADLQREHVRLVVEWTSTGIEERSSVLKFIGPAATRAEDQLRAGGWSHVASRVDGMAVHVNATAEPRDVAEDFEKYAARLDRALENLRF
jgi:serine/threonine protein kinase